MSIAPITPPLGFGVTPSIGFGNPIGATNVGSRTQDVSSISGSDQSFGQILATKVDQLNTMQLRTDELARTAATGNLQDIHQYTIAANESGVATQLAVAVRDRAVEAFNEIMRIQL